MTQLYSCLKVESIQNKLDIPIEYLQCCVCLEIAFIPKECCNCEILICNVCFYLLKLLGKDCINQNCKNSIKKANKYVRDIMSMIVLSCSYCNKKDISYNDYYKHLSTDCKEYSASDIIANFNTMLDLDKTIINKNNKKDELYMCLLNLEENKHKDKYTNINTKDYTIALTNSLSHEEKLILYNAVIKGDIELFKNLILVKKYSIFEEISQIGYKWTPIHYAMHYGKLEIIMFVLNYTYKNNTLKQIIELKSSDGRCPLLCLIKSNLLNIDDKKHIFKLVVSVFDIKINDNLKKELINRNLQILL